MSLDLILDICRKIVDIAIVWILIYTILKNIKSNVKLSLLFKGILFIIIIKIIADYVGLVTIGLLFSSFSPVIRNNTSTSEAGLSILWTIKLLLVS